jgi:hypothetical protein
MNVIRACAAIALIVGAANSAFAQQASSPAGGLRERPQRIHSGHSIDDELNRLTTTLQLSQQQRSEVKVLLQQHQDRIQALIDGKPRNGRLSSEADPFDQRTIRTARSTRC